MTADALVTVEVKSFIWEGRVRRITLGHYPALSVLLARERALALKADITRGHDPVAERERDRAEPNFGAFAARHLDQHARAHKKRMWTWIMATWRPSPFPAYPDTEIDVRRGRQRFEFNGNGSGNLALAATRDRELALAALE